MNDCTNCNGCEQMERKPETIPYIVHESALARAERTIKRLWVLTIILLVLLVGTNAAWLWYEYQMEDIVITQDNTDGANNFIGNDGDIINGKTNDQNQTEENRG